MSKLLLTLTLLSMLLASAFSQTPPNPDDPTSWEITYTSTGRSKLWHYGSLIQDSAWPSNLNSFAISWPGPGTSPKAQVEGTIRAKLKWKSSTHPAPPHVWVIITPHAQSSAGGLPTGVLLADNGWVDPAVGTNPRVSTGQHLKRMRVSDGEVMIEHTFTARAEVSGGCPHPVAASCSLHVTPTHYRIFLSRTDGGVPAVEDADGNYTAHTTWSGMAGFSLEWPNPSFSLTNIQTLLISLTGFWDPESTWNTFMDDAPVRTTKIKGTWPHTTHDDTHFLPYGDTEAGQTPLSVSVRDRFNQSITGQRNWTWIQHKVIENWEHLFEAEELEVVRTYGSPQMFYTPEQSITISGVGTTSHSYTTSWEISASATAGLEMQSLTHKSFGNIQIGASYGQSRSIEEGCAVGIHQQLVLGPRTPGLYQAASILKRVKIYGFADLWDSKGRSSLGAPCIWTPVEQMIIYLDLVAESDLEIENGGDR